MSAEPFVYVGKGPVYDFSVFSTEGDICSRCARFIGPGALGFDRCICEQRCECGVWDCNDSGH